MSTSVDCEVCGGGDDWDGESGEYVTRDEDRAMWRHKGCDPDAPAVEGECVMTELTKLTNWIEVGRLIEEIEAKGRAIYMDCHSRGSYQGQWFVDSVALGLRATDDDSRRGSMVVAPTLEAALLKHLGSLPHSLALAEGSSR